MNAWLTPQLSQFTESPDVRVLVAPGSLWPLVVGALVLLAEAHNWEQFGDATEEETAAFFADMLDDFTSPVVVASDFIP